MVKFGTQQPAAQQGRSEDFLRNAKAEVSSVFGEYLANHEEFDSLDAFLSALDSEVWAVTEKLLKQSYRNGQARNRSAR